MSRPTWRAPIAGRCWLLAQFAAAMFGVCSLSSVMNAQQLGTKLLGGVGIDAGVQSPPGLFIVNRSLHFGAHEVRDRNGRKVPIDGLSIRAFGTATGVAYTMVTSHQQYLTFAIAAPYANIDVNSVHPAASLHGWGFSDISLQPLKLGWRQRWFDFVMGYAVFLPTGKFEPNGGSVGQGHWTHQLSLGGALFNDSTRSRRASLLASYEMNTRTRRVDIRRGNMLHLQGGAGIDLLKIVTIGAAGFVMWQTTADRGSEIPPELRGQWSRVYGLGPEVDLVIPPLGVRLDARVEYEFGARSRPQGRVIAGGISYRVRGP